MYAPMMIWQHNKTDILSNRKAILISGSLEKQYLPPRQHSMQNYTKWVLGPSRMTHPPQIKNWGGNFATHVIPGTNCAKLNVPLAPHNKLHKLQKDANRAKNEHKMQIAFTMTVLTQDMHAMLGIQIIYMFKHFETCD